MWPPSTAPNMYGTCSPEIRDGRQSGDYIAGRAGPRALDRHCETRAFRAPVNCAAELISGGRSNLTFLIFDDASKWVLRRRRCTG